MNRHAEKLRDIVDMHFRNLFPDDRQDMNDAADEIERLEAENALLRRSLEMLTKSQEED